MSTSERAVDRGRRTARSDRLRAGIDIRDARVAGGLSLSVVARSARLSASQVSRIERGLAPGVSVERLVVLGSIVGLDIRIRTFPGGDPIRDAGQPRVLDRLAARLPPVCRVRREVTLGIEGDLRAWDGRIERLIRPDGASVGLEVEVETRIGDGQAFLRRLARKMRDAGIETVLVVVRRYLIEPRGRRSDADPRWADVPDRVAGGPDRSRAGTAPRWIGAGVPESVVRSPTLRVTAERANERRDRRLKRRFHCVPRKDRRCRPVAPQSDRRFRRVTQTPRGGARMRRKA